MIRETATELPRSSRFPEERFRPSRETESAYREVVERGTLRMQSLRVAICGLARNLGESVLDTIARIGRLGRMFADYRVVIYENDSIDDTRRVLQRWQREDPRVTVLAEDRRDPVNVAQRCLERAARMALYRNRYREHLIEHLADFDHAIVVDTDLEGGWSFDGVANTFGHDHWDFVGANGIIYKRVGWQPNVPLQYDAWALRRRGSDEPMTTKFVNAMRWSRGAPLVPVNSCFGGIGIYRLPALLESSYGATDNEHVHLHAEMRRRGYHRLFLNPSLIALYGRKRRKLDPVLLTLNAVASRVRGLPETAWL